jgi:hypothetical protein
MAACGSLQHIFEKPLPENPTLLESLSWNKIKAINPIEQSSFTEIFGELHFKENPESSNSSSSSKDENNWSPSSRDSFSGTPRTKYTSSHKSSDSFSSVLNFDSLQLCTEGLGFESSDDVEEFRDEDKQEEKVVGMTKLQQHHLVSENQQGGELRRSRTSGGAFPPPISCISQSGKPRVCFKSYRQDGRFVLKEIRTPTQEFLHAFREDGRLKLNFVQPNDEILEEEEEEEEEEEVEEEEEENEEEDNDDDKGGKEDYDGVSNGGKERDKAG